VGILDVDAEHTRPGKWVEELQDGIAFKVGDLQKEVI
jgi:hypothetical protein